MPHLFFDLDGTLTDPADGITRCLQHALFLMGREVPPREDLLQFIGPPLPETVATLLRTDDQRLVNEAISHYRDRFSRVGLFENSPYPGIEATLGALGVEGFHLWVVTSKPRVFAQRIIDHFQLGKFFEGVYGAELDGTRMDKRDLIAHVLHEERIDASEAWMIGDRGPDIRGGRANTVRTVGVLWGYGSREELVAAGADVVVESLGELRGCFPSSDGTTSG